MNQHQARTCPPRSRAASRSKPAPVRLLVASLVLVLPQSLATTGPDAQLVSAFYAFEVTVYCGLAAPDVQAGFQKETESIVSRRGIDRAGMEAARMQAWKQAHLEWQNRGIGGYRGWCRTEGSAARARFIGG